MNNFNYNNNNKNNIKLIDGNNLKPEELLKRLILLEVDSDFIQEMDFGDLINKYNTIISSGDNLRLLKIKKILDEDAEREDFECLLLKKRERENEDFSYSQNQSQRYENSPSHLGRKG